MISSTLLAAVPPTTPGWTPGVGLVMILSNLLAIVIGRFVIQNPGKGPNLPVDLPGFEKFGVPELIGTTCLGHILGAGAILGLSNAGVL